MSLRPWHGFSRGSINNDVQQALTSATNLVRLLAMTVGRRGTFDDKDLSFGIESRSLKGCYELMQVSKLALCHTCCPFPIQIF